MTTSTPCENPNEYKLEGPDRLEVLDESGNRYICCNVESIVLSVEDEGKTLKLFVDQKPQ